jgi:hypothetical protein
MVYRPWIKPGHIKSRYDGIWPNPPTQPQAPRPVSLPSQYTLTGASSFLPLGMSHEEKRQGSYIVRGIKHWFSQREFPTRAMYQWWQHLFRMNEGGLLRDLLRTDQSRDLLTERNIRRQVQDDFHIRLLNEPRVGPFSALRGRLNMAPDSGLPRGDTIDARFGANAQVEAWLDRVFSADAVGMNDSPNRDVRTVLWDSVPAQDDDNPHLNHEPGEGVDWERTRAPLSRASDEPHYAVYRVWPGSLPLGEPWYVENPVSQPASVAERSRST